jgi:hypothetical protein
MIIIEKVPVAQRPKKAERAVEEMSRREQLKRYVKPR